MKIIVTGDIHNYFGTLNALINKQQPDLVLCCGDFGFWPGVSWASKFDDIKPQKSKILWCDGNHENFWELAKRQSDEIVPNVIYMPRGSTYTLPDGRTIMFMGGAYSIDKMSRTVGVTWFPEETITQKDMMNLPDIKVDIFITHTCPTELLPTMLYYDNRKINDPSNEALSQLWRKYNPSLWYFGHWHRFIEGSLNDTRWTCLGGVGTGEFDRWWVELPKVGEEFNDVD